MFLGCWGCIRCGIMSGCTDIDLLAGRTPYLSLGSLFNSVKLSPLYLQAWVSLWFSQQLSYSYQLQMALNTLQTSLKPIPTPNKGKSEHGNEWDTIGLLLDWQGCCDCRCQLSGAKLSAGLFHGFYFPPIPLHSVIFGSLAWTFSTAFYLGCRKHPGMVPRLTYFFSPNAQFPT